MNRSIRLLKGFGYSDDIIEKILNCYACKNFKDETLSVNILNDYKSLIKFGFNRKQIIKMTKRYPSIYSYSSINLENKMESLIGMGYLKDEIIHMIKNFPKVLNYNEETIKDKFAFLIKLGYTKEDILVMTRQCPNLYCYSKENIIDKIEFIMSLDYTKEETLKMTKIVPTLFCYGKENIKDKVGYLRSINLGHKIIEDPKMLRQGVRLTFARYEYFKNQSNIAIDDENYRELFINQDTFIAKYDITNSKIIKLYDYDEVKESKKYA